MNICLECQKICRHAFCSKECKENYKLYRDETERLDRSAYYEGNYLAKRRDISDLYEKIPEARRKGNLNVDQLLSKAFERGLEIGYKLRDESL
ncbi:MULTISPECIES: hypothetical protein [unclassified Virgibacillus]|uniref:hypothetical protein n=1 Tax=unclassified Virgibacillus TaxID=2620237 RepID=UPI00090B40C8|nr:MULTISPECIES: hypothetical protein [unclassified Virgibacillus]API92694.1 hypothetical protein BKP57_13295 [Virgibacillus sp. 6R]MBS7428190.1 hypothetical protein [Virgibacillus sp. 19R1-5]